MGDCQLVTRGPQQGRVLLYLFGMLTTDGKGLRELNVDLTGAPGVEPPVIGGVIDVVHDAHRRVVVAARLGQLALGSRNIEARRAEVVVAEG